MNHLTNQQADLDAMQRMRIFSSLSDSDIKEIYAHARVRLVSAGDTLFRRGDQVRAFYGIVVGWVKVYNSNADGNEAVLGVFSTGETFAEAAMFLGGEYPATAEVVEDSRLLEFEKEFFVREIITKPHISQGIMGSMAHHLMRMTREIEQLKILSAEQRLTRFLLNLCHTKQGACSVSLPYEKSLIAARLGMKAETLSRSFAKLKSAGVEVASTSIKIADIDTLRKHGE